MNREQRIEDFFNKYVQLYADGLRGEEDVAEKTTTAFTDCFIEASPLGVNCGKNDKEFRKMIPKGYDFYRSIGTQSMTIVKKDITTLDDFHVMVRVRWKADCIKKNNEQVTLEFEVIYFLQDLNDTLKIFCYIAGDEKKIMKEYGLI